MDTLLIWVLDWLHSTSVQARWLVWVTPREMVVSALSERKFFFDRYGERKSSLQIISNFLIIPALPPSPLFIAYHPLVVIFQIPLLQPRLVSCKCFGVLTRNLRNVNTSPLSTGRSHTPSTWRRWNHFTRHLILNFWIWGQSARRFCKRKRIWAKLFNWSAR